MTPSHAITHAARRRAAAARLLLGESPAQSPGPIASTAPSSAAPPAEARAHGASSATPSGAPRTAAASAPPRRAHAVVLWLAGGSLALAVLAVAFSLRGEADDPASPGQPAPQPTEAPPASAPLVSAPTPVRRPQPEPVDRVDESNVLRALRRASLDFVREPDASLARFQAASGVLGEAWVSLDRAERLAAIELTVEYLQRASPDARGAVASRAAAFAGVDALLTRDTLDAGSILRGAWSAGLCGRALRDRSLDASLREEATARLSALGAAVDSVAPSAAFGEGAGAALALAARKLTGRGPSGAPATREAWAAWDKAVEVALHNDPAAQRALALSAAEALLEGLSARPGDAGARDRLVTLLARLDWSSAGPARAALLEWLADSTRFSTRELAVVTQWLASNAPDSGVGVNETLSAGASGYQRSDLRGRLAARWSGGRTLIAASVLDRWSAAAATHLAAPLNLSTADPVPALRDAAESARLSRAAALLWRGENDGARAVIDNAPTAGAARAREPRLDALSPRAGDGQFALRFLSASQNAQERIDLLRGLLSQSTELGAIDAEVVVEQAMVGSPSEVRRIAQRIVELRADDPAVINAALESLPRSPRTVTMRAMYEAVTLISLPSVDDASWQALTRAALVRRLLDILTGGASLDPADTIAGLLAESYADRAGASQPGDVPALERASTMTRSLLAEARAAGGASAEDAIDALRRRFDARLALAGGEMQRVGVEATNAAEALAAVCAFERPAVAQSAASVVRAMRDAINASTHAAEQLAHAERASLALWAIRIGDTR